MIAQQAIACTENTEIFDVLNLPYLKLDRVETLTFVNIRLRRRNNMKIKAIIHLAEEGGYWAEVPALPGCITEGDTMDELLVNLKDAIEGWLEVANNSQSVESTAQIIEIAV